MMTVTCYVDSQIATSSLIDESQPCHTKVLVVTETIIAFFGISTALLTPFHENGCINTALLCQHANDLIQKGLDGVTLFGTTGEGASIGMDERQTVIRAVLDSGTPANRVTLGLCAPAISDVVLQVQQGMAFGIKDFLLLPPFYFKDLLDDGLFEWHAKVFDAAEPSARFILYHIPQITQVPLSFDLIKRLRQDFPDRVMAVKDSAGQWDDTRAVLKSQIIPVLVGDERLLHKAVAKGGAGSICGMANLYPKRLRTLFDTRKEDPDLSSDVDLIVSYPVIPALKQAMAVITGNPDWCHLRAPLRPLDPQASAAIKARFKQKKVVA